MFQIKDFASISASMINHARSVTKKISDWNPGSASRTIVESAAVEIEELYLQMFIGLREAIPVAVFKSFNFDKLVSAYARGYVSISSQAALTQAISIPLGTAFISPDGKIYNSTSALTWSVGSTYIRVPVSAANPGADYNCPAGTINASPAFSSSTFTVSNSTITTGRDDESDSEREVRFRDYVQSISSGTTVACLNAAKNSVILDPLGNIAEYVVKSGLSEVAGDISIYLYASGGTPSQDLVSAAQRNLDGHIDDQGNIYPGVRSGGVRCRVFSMSERQITLHVDVKMAPGYALNSAVLQALNDQFEGILTSAPPSSTRYIWEIVEELLRVTGVEKVVPYSTANILVAANESLVPGNLIVSEITA